MRAQFRTRPPFVGLSQTRWAPLWLKRLLPGWWTQEQIDRHRTEGARRAREIQDLMDRQEG